MADDGKGAVVNRPGVHRQSCLCRHSLRGRHLGRCTDVPQDVGDAPSVPGTPSAEVMGWLDWAAGREWWWLQTDADSEMGMLFDGTVERIRRHTARRISITASVDQYSWDSYGGTVNAAVDGVVHRQTVAGKSAKETTRPRRN
ncbi:MAG: hypothetical protein ACI8XM_001422 [Haloarculaceae archaeon]|jgi:hypothetical protein